MQNFDQIFTLIIHDHSIGLNLDILETGLLNNTILIGFLIVVGGDFLKSLLEERKNLIIQNIQNAESRLDEAKFRLSQAKKQMKQLNVIYNGIQAETLATKKSILQAEIFDARKELEFRFERVFDLFRAKERQIFFEIKFRASMIILNITIIRAIKTYILQKKPAKILMDDTITKFKLPRIRVYTYD